MAVVVFGDGEKMAMLEVSNSSVLDISTRFLVSPVI
jgi:hypothetical protein